MKAASDAQVRKLMEEMSKHGRIGKAAMKADMDRKTARKYVNAEKLPSELKKDRNWRTRQDAFKEYWPEVEALLVETPELQAKTLFDSLCANHPGCFEPGQLRTFQRRVRKWRALRGPDKEISVTQRHRPGEAAQTDFTSAKELRVTIDGEQFVHLLCVFVLPFSNWAWATVCLSESMSALRSGVQRALFQLGRIPKYHQTDNSTAATHRVGAKDKERIKGSKRFFNKSYLALMRHFGMTPRTTEVGAKEQNGDVEAANGWIKRRLEQALLIRGHRDFESIEAWQAFVDEIIRKVNIGRGRRVREEMDAMRELNVAKLPEFVEVTVRVSERSTIRVARCSYSVPSRLKGEMLKVRIYEDRIEARYDSELQLACERIVGRNQHRIDYRHVIWSLVRKPGGFARYVYREEMFPSLTFRTAYDVIQRNESGTKGDLEYLRILHLAASTLESSVEESLVYLLEKKKPVTVDAVRALVLPNTKPQPVPEMTPLEVDLDDYDNLLSREGAL